MTAKKNSNVATFYKHIILSEGSYFPIHIAVRRFSAPKEAALMLLLLHKIACPTYYN